jgi:hypothetical protein
MHVRLPWLQVRSGDEHTRETDGIPRAIGIAGLLGVGLIHLLDLPHTIHETPYIGWLTIALITGSVLAAAGLVRRPTRVVWTLAASIAAATILAFVISRTVGLPQATDDIGNWNEPLGLASLFVEGVIVGTAASVVWLRRPVKAEFSHQRDRPAPSQRPHRAAGLRGAAMAHHRVVYRHARGATTRSPSAPTGAATTSWRT